MARYPTTAKGWLLTAVAATVVVIAVFASGIGTVLVGAALAGLVAYVLYVVGLNIHSWATTQYERRR